MGSNHEMASLTDREGGSWLRRGLGLPRPPHLIREGTSCVGRCWGRIGFRESGRGRYRLDWIDRIVVGWTGFLALFFGSEMRGADGIWSLGGTFWGEAGRGKMLRAHARRVFFSFSRMQVWLSWAVWFPSQVLGQASVHFLGCSA